MPRNVSIAVGVVVLAFAVWLGVRGHSSPEASRDAADAGADALALAAPSVARSAALDTLPSPTALLADSVIEARDGGPGTVMPDGTPVPPLPLNAPRQVRFGVVLVSYATAQPGPSGGRQASRSRAEAQQLAAKLAVAAQHDFRAAVQQGDEGSVDDVGTVKQGMLEPAPEYVLFTLPSGGVGGPVDTPRGYWIVKRLE